MPDGTALPYWPIAMRAQKAAACLDMSETHFRQHVAPTLTPIRPSPGVVLYRLADLQAWLDRQAGGGAASVDPRAVINAHIQKSLSRRR